MRVNFCKAAVGLLAIISVTACDESSRDTIPDKFVDATNTENWAYYQLDDLLAEPVTVTNPDTDTTWDIAFKRTGVKLNGGDSGMGNVTGALAVSQDSFYTGDSPNVSVFTNASASNEGLTAFQTFTHQNDVASLSYTADMNGMGISGWYNYNPMTHVTTVNADNGWIVRSSDGGSYSRFYLSNLTTAGRSFDAFTFNIQTWDTGTTWNTASTVVVNTNGAVTCLDLDDGSTDDCTVLDWELRIDPVNYDIWLNSGVFNGGAQHGNAAIAYRAIALTGDIWDTVNPAAVHVQWIGDQPAGVFDDNKWYEYNLTGGRQIWPNYRVYAIKDGDTYYKLQIEDYYNLQNVSGFLSVNVERLVNTPM